MKHHRPAHRFACRCLGVGAMAWVGLLSSVAALAAPVTPGHLVITRVGDGTSTLSAVASPVFLDEYTTAGSLV